MIRGCSGFIATVSLVAVLALGCGPSDDSVPVIPTVQPNMPPTPVASAPVSEATEFSSQETATGGASSPTPIAGTGGQTPAPTASTATVSAPPVGTEAVTVDGQTLTVPAGYTVDVYAEDLGAPRFMALDDNGVLYVTDRLGRVLRLPDQDGDGVADAVETALDGLANPHGITFHDGALYVGEEARVIRATDDDGDGTFESIVSIIEGLPEEGHWSRTIRFGPDGMLYLSVGSSCNVCEEEDSLRAAIWRYNADGSGGKLFAAGLRNAVGITFHPETGDLWVTNNGRDGMGDDIPPETINLVSDGDDFGWPRCHSGDIPDPDFGGEGACDGVAQPAVLAQAHSAPLGLAFASGEQLAGFDGDLLVAFHGSWNRSEPTGYKVVRIPFEAGAPAGEVLDFVDGWLLPDGDRWGRPVDVLIAADGSLMISDDEAGRIYRLRRAT